MGVFWNTTLHARAGTPATQASHGQAPGNRGYRLTIDGDHANRFVPQLVAESPVRRFLAFFRRRTDSCSKGSLGQMGAESRHQRLTAFVEGRQFRAEELQYAVVSLALKKETFTCRYVSDR